MHTALLSNLFFQTDISFEVSIQTPMKRFLYYLQAMLASLVVLSLN